MIKDYKRIITISDLPSSYSNLLSYSGYDGILIRRVKRGNDKEFAIEGPMCAKKIIDKLVEMFNTDND